MSKLINLEDGGIIFAKILGGGDISGDITFTDDVAIEGILLVGDGATQQGSAVATFDGDVYVDGAGTFADALTVSKAQNAQTPITLQNTTDSAGANSTLVISQGTSVNNTFYLGAYSQTYAVAAYQGRSVMYTNTGSGGLVFAARKSTGTVDFYAGEATPTTLAMRIDSSQKVLISSLKAAQSHPTNYKQVYCDTDTGELYRIA